VTDLETGHGGFAFATICSHSTNLSFCVRAEDGPIPACALYQPTLNSIYSFSFTGVQTLSNGSRRCSWKGKNPSNNQDWYASADLYNKTGLCPQKDAPPPDTVTFGRKGRWYPQELGVDRCYKSCNYSGGKSFTVKHYVFTDGIVSDFKEDRTFGGGLKSKEEFCHMEPEPVRDSDDEVTYEKNCDDSYFTIVCDFINWYRHDSEMPEAPDVTHQNLNVATHLKTDVVDIDLASNTACFPDYQFKLFLPFSREEVEKTISFAPICQGLESFNNLLRVLYLLHAAMIIFRK
jgi:hypothetical protein